MSFDDIKEDMAFLESWEDRMGYIIDLGKALPSLDPSEQNDLTRVRGCASQVWLVPEVADHAVSFRGGSDAMIVQGLIAVLLARINGHSPSEITEMDIKADFEAIGLAQHLSGQRSNGLASMIERVYQIVKQIQ